MIDRLGTETKWRRTFPDVASACSFARCARKPDEFIRIIPPCGLTADQRKELDDLGVIPTEQFVPPPRSEQLPIGEKGPNSRCLSSMTLKLHGLIMWYSAGAMLDWLRRARE